MSNSTSQYRYGTDSNIVYLFDDEDRKHIISKDSKYVNIDELQERDGDYEIEKYARDAEIFKKLESIEKKQDDHHESTQEEHAEMIATLKKVEIENAYFRNELSKVHTPQRLQKYSVIVLILCLLSICSIKFFNIVLINLYLTYLIALVTLGFYLMSYMMIKQDQKME